MIYLHSPKGKILILNNNTILKNKLELLENGWPVTLQIKEGN